MGVFSDSAHRLLRTKWGSDADLLAEELYALFRQEGLLIDGPVTITNNTTDPALTIDGQRIGGNEGTNPGDEEDGSEEIDSAAGGGGIPAKIVSGGPGSSYSVELYENGIEAASTSTVTATQLQILSTETIPADTWTMATKISDKYYIQVPVWL